MTMRTIVPASSLFVLLLAQVGHAASFSGNPVPKSEWTKSEVPSYIDMYIALPDVMPEKPPILVNIHSCGNNAGGQWSYDGFAPLRAALDSVGFIMILPQQKRNCWNVGAPESLTHDGGGDTGAIVQMVQYALEKYHGDATRVYVMGGSGGGMCTQALLAVYPEIFKAGHERAGVAAGCWAEQYDDGQQWSTPCATGMVDKTPQAWGDYVRMINPAFTGPRPRIQLNHGNADETINFKNLGESIEQWGNVLELDETPTSTDMGFQGTAKTSTSGPVTYNRRFWKDACGYTVMEAWEAIGQKHGMGYESEAILKWFGLDEKRDQDPWDAACGGGAGGSAAGGVDSDESTDAAGTSGEGTFGSDVTGSDATSAGDTSATSNPGGGNAGGSGNAGGAGITSGSVGSGPGTTGVNPSPPPSVTGATPPAALPSAVPVTPGPAVTPSTTDVTATTAPGVTSGGPVANAGRSATGCGVTRGETSAVVPLALLGLVLVLRRRRRG